MSSRYMGWPDCLLNGTVGRAYVFKVAAKREHAHRVFAAIQAVVGMVALIEADGDGDGCLTQREEAYYAADWLWNRNPYFQHDR